MTYSSLVRVRTPFVSLAGALLLAACGGGGGSASTSGGAGSGQKPDPVAVDFPIAYIERRIPTVDPENATAKNIYPVTDLLKPTAFFPGARIILKDRATASANAVDITKDVFKNDPNYDPTNIAKGYDVKDLSVSPDGKKLLFAMRAPFDKKAQKGMGPKWHIYEYDTRTKATPRPIITSPIVADQGDDISPSYLPDGRILFSSTRQTRSKAILLDDGKPQFSANEEGNDTAAFVLHVMKDDGTGIEQITYNQSHDLQPSVMQDGRILYTRWDQFGHDNLSFYTLNPDGTQSQRHYGYISLNQKPLNKADPINRLLRPVEMRDGRILAVLKPDGALLGGDMVVVDTQHFVENTLQTPAGGGTGVAQNPVSILPVSIKAGATDVSIHGRFASAWPLFDGSQRLLVSWSQCRLKEIATGKLVACDDKLVVDGKIANPAYAEADPFYGLWIYNMADQSQLPVVLAEEGKMLTEPVTLEARAPATYKAPATDPALAAENVGWLHIRSVYDLDGNFNKMGSNFTNLGQLAQAAPDARPARFIRITKAVSLPDAETRNNLADNTYGALFNQFANLLEIVAYAPIEPDGSVMVKVPADVALSLQILDKDGKRIGANHTNWLQVRPGETRSCNGCHDAKNLTAGHGRSDAEPPSINLGAASAGSAAQFPGTQRLDKLGAPIEVKMGETMAELASRSYFMSLLGKAPEQRKPTVDLVFDDEWTDPVASKTKSFAYRYADLTATEDDHAPTSAACMETDGWTNLCRVIINYEQHIQPIWERANIKRVKACTACHNEKDINGNDQVPAGNLELVATKSAPNQPMLSYTKLFNGTNKQILLDGKLTEDIPVCMFTENEYEIPICEITLDANNKPTCIGLVDCPFEQIENTQELKLESGQPIPRTHKIAVNAIMNAGGARASGKFFDKFAKFDATKDTFDHSNLLEPYELKLLSEWLDLGGRYYNNPFDSVDK